MRRAAVATGSLGIALSGCLLVESLSGLSGGPEEGDASESSVPDAAVAEAASDAGRAPAFVQAQAASAKDASTLSAAFTTNTRAGNTILVGLDVGNADASLAAITDTQGDAFDTLYSSTFNGIHYYLMGAVGVREGPGSVTVQVDTPSRNLELYVHEYENVGAFGVAVGTSGKTSAVDGAESPVVTTSGANALLFAFGISGTIRNGTGFTARSTYHDNLTEDRALPLAGTYRATATMASDAGFGWVMIATTLLPK